MEHRGGKKYISLREAAKISGYHPDYIGYLVRKGKIKGKKIYGTSAWLVNKSDILGYKRCKIQKREKKAKKSKEPKIFPKKLIYDILPPDTIKKIAKEEILGIKPYKSARSKYLNIGYRVLVGTILLFLIFSSLTGFTFRALGEKEFEKEFYSSNCEGTWQKPQNAQGKPDVFPEGTIESFSEGNSAVYKGGIGDLICKEFKELSKNEEEKLDIVKDFQSAKIYFSFAIDEKGTDKLLLKGSNQAKVRSVPKGEIVPVWERLFNFIAKAQENGAPTTIPENLDGNNIDTKIVIWYSLNGETWYTLDKITSLPLSNAIASGYFNYEAPFLKDWEDIENVKIKFEGVIGGETDVIAFVDSVWVEAKYVEFKKAETKVISLKRHFKGYEEPIIELTEELKEPDTKITLLDYRGKKIEAPIKIGGLKIKIPKIKDFGPGLYKLRIEYKQNREIKTLEQEFSWGVLAINVNKSIYISNKQQETSEVAYIQMAALRDNGHTICDAHLTLEITSPNGQVDSPEVQKSGECGPNNITDKPDYFAYYQVDGPGIYEMKLKNLDNGYEIIDFFEVRESVPFDIERIGPTRIWPYSTYEMTLKIKANQDFEGEVIESVPSSFEVTSSEKTQIRTPKENKFPTGQAQNDTKEIIWDVEWKEGESYEVKYQFDAPDISPYFYLLGPLTISNKQQETSFQEARQWQIASDAIGLENTATPVDFDAANPTISLTVTSANLVVVQVMTKNGTAATNVSDPTDGNYTLAHASGSTSDPPRVATWYKANPTAQTKTITVTIGATEGILGAFGLTGTNASSPIGATAGNTGAGTSATNSITTTYNASWIISVVGADYNPTLTQDASQTSIWELIVGGTPAGRKAGEGTYELKATAGSDTQSWTLGASYNWAISSVEVRQSTLINVSGNAYENETATVWSGCGATANVSLRVGGVTYGPVTCLASDGSFSFSNVAQPAVGTPMVIWFDGVTNNFGSNVNRYSGPGDVTGIAVRRNRVVVQHDDGGTVTNANMGIWDNDNDTDINYVVDVSNNLTVEAGSKIVIPTGKNFSPGANVTTPAMRIVGTYTASSYILELNAGGTSATCTDAAGTVMPLCIDGGTFTTGTSTVNYTGTAATTLAATTYSNLGVGTTADATAVTYTLGGNTTVSSVLTVGNASSTATDTLAGSSYTLTLSGSGTPFSITAWGTFSAGTSTVNYTATAATTLAAATYNNLGVGTTANATATTYTLGGNTTVSSVLTVGNASSTATDILAGSLYTLILSGSGTPFVLTTFGTFSAGTSTVKYTGTGVTTATFYGHTDDGLIYGDAATYATARSTSTAFDTTSTYFDIGQMKYLFDSGGYMVYRPYLLFDTSAIPDGAAITDVKLYMVVYSDSSATDFDVRIHKYNWENPISAANQEANYDGALAATLDQIWRNTSGIVLNTYYASPSLDNSWVNKTGYTKYALVSSRDVNNTAPTGLEYVGIYSTENATYKSYLTVTYITAAATNITTATYNNLELSPSGAGSPTFTLGSGTTTTNGYLTIGDGTYAVTVTTTTNNPTVTITTDLIVNTSATLSGSGTGTITVNGGDVTGNGTINLTSGTFLLNNTGNFGGNTNWTFYNLTFGDGSGNVSPFNLSCTGACGSAACQGMSAFCTSPADCTGTTSSTCSGSSSCPAAPANSSWTGGTCSCSSPGGFCQGSCIEASPGTCIGGGKACSISGGPCTYQCFSGWYNCDGNNSNGCESSTPCDTTTATGTGDITVSNNFTIATAATLDAASKIWTVAGNWSNSGTFTYSTSNVVFNDNTKTSTFSGSTTFYNLTSNTASKNLTFTAGTTQSIAAGGTLTLNGGACATMIVLRSSATPTQWNINVAATATANVNYVDVKDSNATGSAITANNSFDSNNNNWTINVGECGAETLTFTISTVAAANCTGDTGSPTVLSTTLANEVDFGVLDANIFKVACHELTVTTNASNGYILTSQETTSLKYNSNLIYDTTCDGGSCSQTAQDDWTNATVNWGLGHTCTNTSGTDCNTVYTTPAGACGAAPCYRQFACVGSDANCEPGAGAETAQTFMSNAGAVSSNQSKVHYKISRSGTQAIGLYQNTIIYIVTPTY